MTRRIQQWTSVIGIEWLLEDAARWNLVWTDRWTGKLKAALDSERTTKLLKTHVRHQPHAVGLHKIPENILWAWHSS
jgi:hypothetical protein